MKNNLLLKNMWKVALFSLPISSSMLISMVSSFIAMLMVAQISKIELAAGAIAVSTYITIMTVVTTIFYSLGILISHLRGQKNSEYSIGQIVKNGLWLAIFLAVPSSIALWNMDSLLLLFNQDSQLVNVARNYFHYAAFNMIPLLIGSVISQFFVGIGKPRFMTIISLIISPLMIFLSYGFILGHYGLPKLGLAGVSCASLIAQLLTYAIIILYMYLVGIIKKYNMCSFEQPINWNICRKILLLGYPIGIQFGAEIGAMTVATYLLGYFGVTALAAAQVVQQYVLLAVMITLGLSQGVSILISQECAKNNTDLIKQYIHAMMMILFIFSLKIAILFWLCPTFLLKFYLSSASLNDIELIHLAKKLFVIAAIMIFVDGVRNILSGCLRGLQDSKTPMKIGVICLWGISLPLSYIMGFYFNGGPVELRMGFLCGFIVAAIILWKILQAKISSIVFTKQSNMQYSY